jgi:hypothetical protein
MMNEMETLKAALFEIFSAGFEAGYTKDIDLKTAFEEWYQKAMLAHLPPDSPFVS